MSQRCVLFISHEYPPEGGGAGRNLAFLAEALAPLGWTVRIWAGRGNARDSHDSGSTGLQIRWVSTQRSQIFVTSLWVHLRFLLGCSWKKYRETWGLEVSPTWICANMAWPAGWAAKRLSRKLGIPYAIWHHGSDVHGGKTQGASRLQRSLLRYLWEKCALVFFVSESLRTTAATYGNLPPSEIVASMVNPQLASVARKGSHPIPKSPGTFLFLGRFEKVKEPQVAINALWAAHREGHGFRLRMIGQGSLRPRLVHAIKQCEMQSWVTLEDEVEHQDLPAIFADTLALIMPSRVEGLSLTALEAASFGIPILAADVPGLRENIQDRATGLLFAPGDSEALARCMAALAQDNELRSRLSQNARAWSEGFTPSRSAQTFDSALCHFEGDREKVMSSSSNAIAPSTRKAVT